MMAQGRRRLLLGCLLQLLFTSVATNGTCGGLEAAVAVSPLLEAQCQLESESYSPSDPQHTTTPSLSHITARNNSKAKELEEAKDCIQDFLDTRGYTSNSDDDKIFHVQGWRWHTLSLVRDARRLAKLASSASSAAAVDNTSLKRAAQHVIEFNMKALHRIESDLFYPWLRTQLTAFANNDNPNRLAQAFSLLLDDIVAKQSAVSKIGSQVMAEIDVVHNQTISESERRHAMTRIADLSANISSLVETSLNEQDEYIVPAIAILVPSSKQRALNNRVIFNLGVRDSRLHLVGMHEAVLERNDERELALFEEEIPSIPRYMIPRWKRLLYDPQASVLEEPV